MCKYTIMQKYILVIASMLFVNCADKYDNNVPKTNNKQSKTVNTSNALPKTLEEAVTHVLAGMTDKDKDIIKNKQKYFI